MSAHCRAKLLHHIHCRCGQGGATGAMGDWPPYGTCATGARHCQDRVSCHMSSRVLHFRWDRGLAMRRTAFRLRVARDRLRCVSQVNQDIWSRTCRMHNIYTYETIWPRTYGLEHGLVPYV